MFDYFLFGFIQDLYRRHQPTVASRTSTAAADTQATMN